MVVRASQLVRSLANIRQLQRGRRGGHGGKQKQQGTKGSDAVIKVPLGTIVTVLQPSAPSAQGAQGASVPWLQCSMHLHIWRRFLKLCIDGWAGLPGVPIKLCAWSMQIHREQQV